MKRNREFSKLLYPWDSKITKHRLKIEMRYLLEKNRRIKAKLKKCQNKKEEIKKLLNFMTNLKGGKRKSIQSITGKTLQENRQLKKKLEIAELKIIQIRKSLNLMMNLKNPKKPFQKTDMSPQDRSLIERLNTRIEYLERKNRKIKAKKIPERNLKDIRMLKVKDQEIKRLQLEITSMTLKFWAENDQLRKDLAKKSLPVISESIKKEIQKGPKSLYTGFGGKRKQPKTEKQLDKKFKKFVKSLWPIRRTYLEIILKTIETFTIRTENLETGEFSYKFKKDFTPKKLVDAIKSIMQQKINLKRPKD